jgi:hypothetical protein
MRQLQNKPRALKIKMLLAAIVLLSANLLNAQQDISITWNYDSLTFKQFIAAAEEKTGIRFFFRDDWVQDLRPGDYPGITSLSELLDKMFKGKFLYSYRDNDGDFIITKDHEIEHIDNKATKQNLFTLEEYSYEQEKQKTTESIHLDIGNPAEKDLPGNVNISGYIIESDSRESLSGTTVYIQDLSAGTISNQYGFFNVNLPRGAHLIQFSFIGMKEKRVYVNVYGAGELNIEMNSALIPLRETVVYGQRNAILQRYESGVVKIDIESVKFQPTSLGEPDIIKSILLVPGILSVGEGSVGFNVRGGSSDQNLMLLYGAPVYYPSHFFGFFTSVNADIIKDFTILKGGMPARYGGRISSVIDINTKDGNRRELTGNAGISPVTTHILVEGPIKKDKASFILAGRTTYSNWVLRSLDDPAIRNSEVSFYDLNAGISYDINNNNKIYISSYFSHDAFRLNSDTLYNFNNNIVSVRWRHSFSSRHYGIVSLYNSYYGYIISSNKWSTEAFIMSHRINSTGIRAEFNLYQGKHEIRYGLDLIHHSVLPGRFLPLNDSSLILAKRIPKEQAVETSVYIDERYPLSESVSINAGLRFSTFLSLGPGSVLVYNPELSKQESSVTDTLHFKRGGVISHYTGPELRLSVNIRLSDNSSLKINYNHMRQYLNLLSNTIAISPTDTWKLSDYYLKPQVGDQYAAGIYKLISDGKIEASFELYYKKVKNMVDFKGMSDLVMNEHIEMDLAPVKGKAYGFELMFRKSTGRNRWDLGYTWAKTLLQSTGNFRDEIINSGKWFPANYDKPNNLTFTYTFLYSRRLSFSSNYTWSTGRPVTYPITSYYIGNKLVVQYSDRNQYRIPDYARLDVSCTINGNLRSHKIANPHLVLSVYNLLGRQNVYSVYFRNDKNILYGYKLSIFGRAIPSVSFNFDF